MNYCVMQNMLDICHVLFLSFNTIKSKWSNVLPNDQSVQLCCIIIITFARIRRNEGFVSAIILSSLLIILHISAMLAYK